MKKSEIKTTGQLRAALAKACQDVIAGELDIDKAQTLHKLAKNISESLYSETKIAMFRSDVGMEISEIGALPLGDRDSD